MAKYTIELRTLLNDPIWKEEINKALSEYPMYERTKEQKEWIPSYIPTREELNKKILDHFKYREIGQETPARFVDELRITMNEIMPYYSQLFFSTDQDYNLLYNVDYKRTHTLKVEGTSTSTGTNDTTASDSSTTSSNIKANNKAVKVDTPQNELSIGTTDIDNISYASEMSFNENLSNESGTSSGNSTAKSTSTGEGSQNTKEEYEENIKGNYGQMSFQSLLTAYRELIINVERQIINDERLQELFMQVY